MNIRSYIPLLVGALGRKLTGDERARVHAHKARLARLTTRELERRAMEGGLGDDEQVAPAELLKERGLV